MATSLTANIKMYRMGELGDCFLVTFKKGTTQSHMLIDCGSFRNGGPSKKRLNDVVSDIQKKVGNRKLEIAIGTHQHNDHVNGYVHCKDLFEKIKINQSWFSWLDSDTDKDAARIAGKHKQLLLTLTDVNKKLMGAGSTDPGTKAVKEKVAGLMGFFGVDNGGAPETPKQGIANLKNLSIKKPAYLLPGQIIDFPGLPKGDVKIYVLGPPKDDKLLYDKDPSKGESYDKLRMNVEKAEKFLAAFSNHNFSDDENIKLEEEQYPFNYSYRHQTPAEFPEDFRKLINGQENKWRAINNDWMEQAERLALYMDEFTNNSSLAFAIELVHSKKVLLFAADAQTGNWLSWKKVKWEDNKTTLDDLLSRTVFYKTGHHGSHNATLVEVFEKMTNEKLVAMIPVDKTDPNIKREKGGWKMPATNLYKRMKQKTNNRILLMDNVFAEGCDPGKNSDVKKSWKMAGIDPKSTDLYIEIDIKG